MRGMETAKLQRFSIPLALIRPMLPRLKSLLIQQRGFSLAELLITLTISTLVLAGVYQIFISHQKAFALREQIAEMQQNARIGMDMLVRELRMAGYDPSGRAGAGIVKANAQSIHFTIDLNGDGDTEDANEDITYSLYDSGKDGDLDLGRKSGDGVRQPVAENIQNLEFVYILADGTTTSTPADPNQIRTIQVTLIARTAKPDKDYQGNNGYRTMSLTTRVQVRNKGL